MSDSEKVWSLRPGARLEISYFLYFHARRIQILTSCIFSKRFCYRTSETPLHPSKLNCGNRIDSQHILFSRFAYLLLWNQALLASLQDTPFQRNHQHVQSILFQTHRDRRKQGIIYSRVADTVHLGDESLVGMGMDIFTEQFSVCNLKMNCLFF